MVNPTAVVNAGLTCCAALASILGDAVSFPGDETYESSQTSYFSQQQSSVHPNCVASPSTADDVSTILRTLYKSKDASHKPCKFAIRSGGHMIHRGASNIDGGVTIDLRALDSITLSEDHSVASVGPGATWRDVYSKLGPLGYTIAGGRVASVGVGGLTVGGGVSYLSPRYGFTSDTVISYQVVLANGTIIVADEDENADLLRALRGGSNNFGIVTRINYKPIEQGLMFGGSITSNISTAYNYIEEMVKINGPDYDEYASIIGSWAYNSAVGQLVVSNAVYTKPEPNPEVYKDLLALPSLASTMRITDMLNLTEELDEANPSQNRQLYRTMTVKSSEELLKRAFDSWNSTVSVIQSIQDITYVISIQPLPPSIYQRHATENSLGLENRSENLFIILLSTTWTQESDDDLIIDVSTRLFEEIGHEASKLDVDDPYIYYNYAGATQDPIKGYGSESVRRLKNVRRKYDPTGVFTNRVPGGFKIPK